MLKKKLENMGFCKHCGSFNTHIKSCRLHPSKAGEATTPPATTSQGSNNTGTTHPNQTCIRWSLLIACSLLLLIGLVLLILGATAKDGSVGGKTVGGILLLCFGLIAVVAWLCAAFCCEYRWCCPTF